MLAALVLVLNEQLLRNKATALHGVPPLMLKDSYSGRVIHNQKPGHKLYLPKQEERNL